MFTEPDVLPVLAEGQHGHGNEKPIQKSLDPGARDPGSNPGSLFSSLVTLGSHFLIGRVDRALGGGGVGCPNRRVVRPEGPEHRVDIGGRLRALRTCLFEPHGNTCLFLPVSESNELPKDAQPG